MLANIAFFHRLSRFPGPFLARLGNFYIMARVLRTHQEYSVLQSLHNKYGGRCEDWYVTLGVERRWEGSSKEEEKQGEEKREEEKTLTAKCRSV